jgi:UPF0176 protein
MSQIVVVALYKFVSLPDYKGKRDALLTHCQSQDVWGTLLLAEEGINGTIAGPRGGIDSVLAYLRADKRLVDLEHKESFCEENPFLRMKVKLKKEIVTLGVEGVSPTNAVGQYVKPEDWNALISDPDVVVVDTRNDYEYEIGTFKGAIDPNTESFREFPEYVEKNLDPAKHKKVAMFCTGGIRCEKSTSYMLEQGFDEVYHLQGGILKYLEEVPAQESLWEGECFVFDERVAVKHNLEEGQYDQCHACRHPITEEDKKSEHYVLGISCPKCVDKMSDEQRQRFAERQKQIDLANKRGVAHMAGSLEDAKARKAQERQRLKALSDKGQAKADKK